MKKTKEQKAITLIALIITIVVLLILAVVSIRAVQGNKIIEYAKNAASDYETSQDKEQTILQDYLYDIQEAQGQEIVEISMKEAQGKVLSNSRNVVVVDDYGNKIVVPARFKITTDSNNVTEGIVIEDCTTAATNGSQFVWIPVGTVYTNAEQTESETIELKRYVFNSDGSINEELSVTNPSDQLKTSSSSSSYFTEGLKNDTTTNAHAKDIEGFISSTKSIQEGGNGGYYIGRYEAGTKTARSSSSNKLTQLIVKSNVNVYNYVTQLQASSLSRGMYEGNAETNVISDLINSYAWDTAIVFIQTFSTERYKSTYSMLNESTSFTVTGGNGDEYCNINDMSGNATEWSTETSNFDDEFYCVGRGGYYIDSAYGGICNETSFRWVDYASYSDSCFSFRPLIYVGP